MYALTGFTNHVCPVCRSEEFHLFCLNGSRPLKRCTVCAFFFAEKIPASKEVEQEYRQKYSPLRPSRWNLRRRIVDRLQTRLVKLLMIRRRKIRTLHLGFGEGELLKHLEHQRRFESMGLEMAPHFVDEAREQSLEVYQSSLEEMKLKDQIFDFIHASDRPGFFQNPERTCLEIHRVLAPGGVLFLSLPRMPKLSAVLHGEMWGEETCEQLWHFTSHNASLFLQRLGFRVHFARVPRDGSKVFLIAGKQPNLEWDEIPRWIGLSDNVPDLYEHQILRPAA